MTSENIIAVVLISLALIFYSIGVWSERFAERLKAWHLIFFCLGVVFDCTGTAIMMGMAGAISFDVHGVSGVLAILLMTQTGFNYIRSSPLPFQHPKKSLLR